MLQELFNVLDLPGSSVRDLLAGENPLDQWASPLSDRHRVSGAELVSKYTGARPDSWGSTIAGFGAEMLLDPTNLIGGAGMLKRAVAARRAMTANKSIDALNAGAEAANLGRYGMVNAGRVDDLSSPLTAIPAAVPESVTGRGLPYDPMVGYQAEPFYSKIQDVVASGKIPNQVGRDQLLATLKGSGISPEEVDDLRSPLSAAFNASPRQKIGRDQLENLADDNIAESVQVTKLGLPPDAARLRSRMDELRQNLGEEEAFIDFDFDGWFDRTPEYRAMEDEYYQVSKQLAEIEGGLIPPKFSSYQLPGGSKESYQEVLVRNPALKDFTGGHWRDFPDTIASVRADEINLPDGRKSFRIAEIQSDLHQKGEKRGYIRRIPDDAMVSRGPLPITPSSDPKFPYQIDDGIGNPRLFKDEAKALSKQQELGDHMLVIDPVTGDVVAAVKPNIIMRSGTLGDAGDDAVLKYVRDSRPLKSSRVPDTPFKKSWVDLAAKTALRTAVEGGYDTVSLAKGVDIANSVGGPPEALSRFYDEKVYQVLKKLVKKHGGDVSEVSVRDANDVSKMGDGLNPDNYVNSPLSVSVFEIPKKLKAEILRKGLPAYGSPNPLRAGELGRLPEPMVGSLVRRPQVGTSPLVPSEDLMTSPLMPRQEVPRSLRPREAFGLAAYNAGARSGGYTVEP